MLLAAACGGPSSDSSDTLADGVLRLGILPDDRADRVVERYQPIADHLASLLDVEVALVVPDSYSDLTADFADGSVDLAVFGAVSFLRAHDESGALPFAMRDIDDRFQTALVVRQDDPGTDLFDFVGRRLVFGSELSTSGHLMPRYYLGDVFGLVPEEDFTGVDYSGSHGDTLTAVLDGSGDLGAVNKQVFEDLVRTGVLAEDALRVVWITPPYVNYVWAAQPSLDVSVRTDLLAALLGLSPSTPAGQAILTPLGSRGFIPASIDDFTDLREVGVELGLLEPAP